MIPRRIHPAHALACLLAIPLMRPGPPPAGDPSGIRRYRPDLNRDSEGRIRLIPGIGPAKARAIVEEREENGLFRGPADVRRRVRGIGPALEGRLREFAAR